MGHRFLEHTADLRIELSAADREGIFAAAVAAFTDAMTDPAAVEPRQERDVRLSAPDAESLLVDFLGELLFLFEVEGLLFCEAVVEVRDEGGEVRLAARLRGEPYDPLRHPIKVLVKAVTYHGLELRRREDGWVGRVVLDI